MHGSQHHLVRGATERSGVGTDFQENPKESQIWRIRLATLSFSQWHSLAKQLLLSHLPLQRAVLTHIPMTYLARSLFPTKLTSQDSVDCTYSATEPCICSVSQRTSRKRTSFSLSNILLCRNSFWPLVQSYDKKSLLSKGLRGET